VALHLDHGDTYELCVSCIESGFSSVMIDGSAHPYAKNVELTAKVVEYAHKHDVTVEGELGVLAGIEDDVSHAMSHYTNPEDVEDFVKKTGVDSLAISIGTSHGAFKFKVKPGESAPPLRFDILEEVEKRIPGFPIVLHGASSVVQEYVEMINKYGGKMEGAVGVSEEQLRRAAKSAVCKINIDSDGRLVVTAIIRKVFAEKPGEFDPRKYLGPARDELVKLIKHKNTAVLGSANRA
jgi:fructose-bisphosphate aldolase class II